MSKSREWINWKRTVIKTYEVEPSNLVLNWSICECPECGGQGEIHSLTGPDTYEKEWMECDNCGGTGELAINDRGFHRWDSPIWNKEQE